MKVDLLVEHSAELCTLAGAPGARRGSAQADLGIVEDGAVACSGDGRIVAVGPTPAVRAAVTLAAGATVIDAGGHAVIPGLVDPHTHLVFAGDRAEEFVQRLEGADYLAILAAGGGILSTVRATRAASPETLLARARGFLDEMLLLGTTTVEIKSGYGLTVDDELKQLRVIEALRDIAEQTLVGTLLGAHAVPPEFRDAPDKYVTLVCDERIPAVAAEGLATYCDVFCETGVFTVEQSRRVLQAGRGHGLLPKIHAEQKSRLGGTQLGAELCATSVDHLEYADDDDLRALAETGTVTVFLPGAALMLRETRIAPARRAVDLGVPVALASDFNQGTCPILSLPVIIGLACLRFGLTPAESLVAATINAAHAVGLGDEVGSLEPGKRADLLILDAPSHRYLPYFFARNLVQAVVKDGSVVVKDRRRVVQ